MRHATDKRDSSSMHDTESNERGCGYPTRIYLLVTRSQKELELVRFDGLVRYPVGCAVHLLQQEVSTSVTMMLRI
jgi:hypothetical protein